MLQNTQIFIVRNEEQRQKVVEFMLENNIAFQAGFTNDDTDDLADIASDLGYEGWNSSSAYC